MKVEVYWNFHRKLFSIRAAEGREKGRVIAHAYHVTLWGAEFRVSAAGRERVRREKRKNVHAVVRGTLDIQQGDTFLNYREAGGFFLLPESTWSRHWAGLAAHHGARVSYNPYENEGFHNGRGRLIEHAAVVDMQVLSGHARMCALGVAGP